MKIKFKQNKIWWLGGLILIVLVAAGLVIVAQGNDDTDNIITLAPTTLGQSVSVSGQVKPASKADLAFDRSGRISAVLAQVGEEVAAGAVLVRLASTELSAEFGQAGANLAVEQARLAELERGARPEDLAVSRAQVTSLEDDFLDSQKNLARVLQDTFVRADNALRYQVDLLFINPGSSVVQMAFSISPSREEVLEKWRSQFEWKIRDWQKDLLQLSAGADLSIYYNQARSIVLELQNRFNDLSDLVADLSITDRLSNDLTVTQARDSISAARTAISTALDVLESAWRDYNTAWNALELARRELSLILAGSSAEEVSAQAARVAAAWANVDAARAALGETVLVAPFPAIVTYQEARVGEVAPAGIVLTKLSAIDPFIIEANIPEVDIAKVKTGDLARVTLDAYGPTAEFVATVGQIDPAETVLDGVPTYKVTLHFNAVDERVRSGMTANITLTTGERQGVLAVPLRALTTLGGRTTVQVQKGEEILEQEVQIGLISSDGQAEILSGLQAGDRVVMP